MKIEYYIETTLLQFLKTKSIDGIRVIDLIDEIGICKGTFYKYYKDKYHLLVCCFQKYYYNDILKGAEDWETFVGRSLSAFKKTPAVLLNAFDSQDINSLRGYHEELMSKYFFMGGSAEKEELYVYSAEAFAHYTTDMLIEWLKNKCAQSPSALIERMKAVMPVTLYNGLMMNGENK